MTPPDAQRYEDIPDAIRLNGVEQNVNDFAVLDQTEKKKSSTDTFPCFTCIRVVLPSFFD